MRRESDTTLGCAPAENGWVVIVGAASGLGRELALRYASSGERVALLDRDAEGLREVRAEIEAFSSRAVLTHTIDLSEAEPAFDCMLTIAQRLGDVRLVVVSAGVASGSSVGESGNFAHSRRMLAVNAVGTIACLEAWVQDFRLRGHGHIAVIGSIASLRGLPGNGYAGYGASKAAVRAYVQSLQAELIRDRLSARIVATIILPGHFASGMVDPADRFVTPMSTVASDIMRAIRRHKREHVATGWIWWLQSRVIQILPIRMVARLDTGGDQ